MGKPIRKKLKQLATLLQQLQPDSRATPDQIKRAFEGVITLFCEVTGHSDFKPSSTNTIAFLAQCFQAAHDFLKHWPNMDLSSSENVRYTDQALLMQSMYQRHCPVELTRTALEQFESTLSLVKEQRNEATYTPILEKKAGPWTRVAEHSCDALTSTLLTSKQQPMMRAEDTYESLSAQLLALRDDVGATFERWFVLKQASLAWISQQRALYSKTTAIDIRLQHTELAIQVLNDYIDVCVKRNKWNKIAAPRRSMIRLFQQYADDYEQTDVPDALKKAFREKVTCLHEDALRTMELSFYQSVLKSDCVDAEEQQEANHRRRALVHSRRINLTDLLQKHYELIQHPLESANSMSYSEKMAFLQRNRLLGARIESAAIAKCYALSEACLQEALFDLFCVPLNRGLGVIDPPLLVVTDGCDWHDWYGDTAEWVKAFDCDALKDNDISQRIGDVIDFYFYYKKELASKVQSLNQDAFIADIRMRMYQALFQPVAVGNEGCAAAYAAIIESSYAGSFMKKLAHYRSLSVTPSAAQEDALPTNAMLAQSSTKLVASDCVRGNRGNKKKRSGATDSANEYAMLLEFCKDDDLILVTSPDWNEYMAAFTGYLSDEAYDDALQLTEQWMTETALDAVGDPNVQARFLFDALSCKLLVLQQLERYSDALETLNRFGESYLVDAHYRSIRLQQRLTLKCQYATFYDASGSTELATNAWDEVKQLAKENGVFCFEAIWKTQFQGQELVEEGIVEEMVRFILDKNTSIILLDRQWDYFYWCYKTIAELFALKVLKKGSYLEQLMILRKQSFVAYDEATASAYATKSIAVYEALLGYCKRYFPDLRLVLYNEIGQHYGLLYLSFSNSRYQTKAREAYEQALSFARTKTEQRTIQARLDVVTPDINLRNELPQFISILVQTQRKVRFFKQWLPLLSPSNKCDDRLLLPPSTQAQLESAISDYFLFLEARNVLLLLEKILKEKPGFSFSIQTSFDEAMINGLMDLTTTIKAHESSLQHYRFQSPQRPTDAVFREWLQTETYLFVTLIETANMFALIFDESLPDGLTDELQQAIYARESMIERLKTKIDPSVSATPVRLPTQIDLRFGKDACDLFSWKDASLDYKRALAALTSQQPSYAMHYLFENSVVMSAHPVLQKKQTAQERPMAYCCIWLLEVLRSASFQQRFQASDIETHLVPAYADIYRYAKHLCSTTKLTLFNDTLKNTLQPRLSQLPAFLEIIPQQTEFDRKDCSV